MIAVVSNDDVAFTTQERGLEPIGRMSTTAAVAVLHTFTVPAGERWVVHHLKAYRSHAAWMWLTIRDLEGVEYELEKLTGNTLIYIPQTRFALKAGWDVVVNYDLGTSGNMWTLLMYQKEVDY